MDRNSKQIGSQAKRILKKVTPNIRRLEELLLLGVDLGKIIDGLSGISVELEEDYWNDNN